MVERRPQPEPKKKLTLTEAQKLLREFLDNNPHIVDFFPSIPDELETSEVNSQRSTILPIGRIKGVVRKHIITNDKGTSSIPVDHRDIPHTGKNRT